MGYSFKTTKLQNIRNIINIVNVNHYYQSTSLACIMRMYLSLPAKYASPQV
eukprot:UN05027